VEYIFTLKFQLAEADRDADALVERLGAGGCDDALVGIGQPGRIALEFTREADSAKSALMSALSDLKRLMPGARLVEASPDYVGLTDVADIVGVSRQYMRKLMVNHPDGFPVPVHEGVATVWHLADILCWLRDRGTPGLEERVLDVAQTNKQINLARQLEQLSVPLRKGLRALVV